MRIFIIPVALLSVMFALPGLPSRTPEAIHTRLMNSPDVPDWKQFLYEEDGFAISAPTEPGSRRGSATVGPGEVEQHFYSVSLGDDSGWMAIAYTLDPDDKRSPEIILADKRDSALESVHGKLISEMPIVLEGYLGLQVELESEKYRARSRYYVVGRRMYELLSIAPMDRPIHRETDRFFRGFRLIVR
ncbi:MAG TPA: hypothetical protein VE783_06180 [Candidatus Limnocylindrales bacterium]|nr:hypothetical protein [Candidatus Limnocylindrales bacterium]